MEPQGIKILGAGGHALVVAEIIRAMGLKCAGFLGRGECRREVQGVTLPELVDSPLFIAIGDNSRRRLIAENLQAIYPVLISPRAYISPSSLIGEGSVIMPMAAIETGAQIGRHCIVNTSAVVDHECRLADYVHISPGAVLCGNVFVGQGAWIGAGAVVLPGISIGADAIVGAGSTVLRDVPPSTTAVGVWKG
ncbi:MAG: acetyltransferase [Muribaculum sp.]|nr:acetyltransferase [Muribaculum sp.]